MSGTWSHTNPPVRPGGYTNWKALQQQVIPPNLGSIVCVPFTHNWGPYKIATLTTSWDQWQQVYGSDDTPGSRAIKGAFFGEGVPGYGGAGAVVGYRFGTATGGVAAKASLTLNRTGTGTPAALALTAKYNGTRANRLNVTVRTNAQSPTAQDLVIYDAQTPIESYTFLTTPTDGTPIADLAALINRISGFVNASVTSDGTSLGNIANAPLTGGLDGATLVAQDWTDMLTAVQGERFSIFAPFDNIDQSIATAINAWNQGNNASGKRVMAFSGGALNEISSTALGRSLALNDPNHVTLGVGGAVDFDLIGTPQAPVALSTSQLAPRVAGIFASRGGAKPLTFARLAGTDFRVTTATGVVSVNTASDIDVVNCIQNGVVPLTRDSNQNPIRLEKGVTTWQPSNTDPDRPYSVWSVAKFVKIMQDFEMQITEFVEAEVVTPGLPYTQATKEFVQGHAMALLGKMATSALIQPGYSVNFNTTGTTPFDNFLTMTYQWVFTRPVEQVRNTVVVG